VPLEPQLVPTFLVRPSFTDRNFRSSLPYKRARFHESFSSCWNSYIGPLCQRWQIITYQWLPQLNSNEKMLRYHRLLRRTSVIDVRVMNFWKRVCVARPDPVLTNRFLTLQKKSGSRSGCHVMFGPYGYNTNIKSAHTFLVRWSNKICCNSNYILQSATSVAVDSYRERLNKAATFF
jgi:hypothetical protein